jgi:hypothetical protein
VSSLSGSASDSEESDTPSVASDRITRLLHKQRLHGSSPLNPANNANDIDSDEEAEQAEYRRRAELRTALIWFNTKKEAVGEQGLVPSDTQFGVHRALLPNGITDAATFVPALRSVQIPMHEPFNTEEPDKERKITLLMVAGGHFAGMVVGLKPVDLTQGKGKRGERQEVKGAGEMRVLQHKTFHRYTSESRK